MIIRTILGWAVILFANLVTEGCHWLLHMGAWMLDQSDVMKECQTCNERKS